jgi:lipoprotein NlpD
LTIAVRTGIVRQPGAWVVLPVVAALIAMVLGGCASTHPAPVIERGAVTKRPLSRQGEPDWRPDTYTVRKGDTLYSIALEHGLDYKEIAEWNNIDGSYVIRIGQQLKMHAPAQVAGVTTSPLKPAAAVEAKVVGTDTLLKTGPKAIKQVYSDQALAEAERGGASAANVATAPEKPAADKSAEKTTAERAQEDKGNGKRDLAQSSSGDDDDIAWGWPAKGKIISNFNDANGAKGIDISGTIGQSVFAAAPGKVVYSGSGLRGYGKLIIIKHNKTYLSAYAHNSQILVKEGQSVVKGQKIAEIGDSDSDQIKLHFEIRRFGKPVDPLKYLPSDKT